MDNNILKRILIDLTFEQFTKKDNHKLIGLQEWPSEKLDKDIVNELLTSGIVEINADTFNEYLKSFRYMFSKIYLDDYLLNKKIKTNYKR